MAAKQYGVLLAVALTGMGCSNDEPADPASSSERATSAAASQATNEATDEAPKSAQQTAPLAAAPSAPSAEPGADLGNEAPRGEVATDLFITAVALRARLAEPEPVTLIDVRPTERYDAYHIPNALRLEPVALGHAAPSRVGRGVVITDGHGADGIAEKVAGLREKGLDLVVLHGGMQAWCRMGGATTLPCRGADRMAPTDLARGAGDGDRLVVVAIPTSSDQIDKQTDRARALLPDALILQWSSPDELAEAVAKAQTASEARQVAIVDVEGTSYGELRDALWARIDAHLFFVDLGLRGVESYQQSREAMLSRRTIVSQGARQAGSSGRRPAVVRAPKGCGCL